jgi:hypothetical protein
MFQETYERAYQGRDEVAGARNAGQLIYTRKFKADFLRKMNQSVRANLKIWAEESASTRLETIGFISVII